MHGSIEAFVSVQAAIHTRLCLQFTALQHEAEDTDSPLNQVKVCLT